MWFKNLVIYRFKEPVSVTAELLEEKLGSQCFRPCGKIEHMTSGWAPPIPEGKVLVHESNGCLLFSLCQEERLLPPSVVREAVTEKVVEIEQDQGRQVFRKEKEQIRDEITLSLLPRAFTRKKMVYAFIDLSSGYLIVDASSFRIAEQVTSLLRKSLGSLAVSIPEVKISPATLMTHWLKQAEPLPAAFTLADECELAEPGENGSLVQCKRQELVSEEIIRHLDSGKLVSRLGLQWNDNLSCILHDNLCVKRLKFSDGLLAQSEANDSEDKKARFDADFSLMALTLRAFIGELFAIFDQKDSREKLTKKNSMADTEMAMA